MYIYYYDFAIVRIGIAEHDGRITHLISETESMPEGYNLFESDITKKAAGQLDEYFDGQRKIFELPLAPQGTDFQKKVWEALRIIPYGETRSYKQIAETVGTPKAFRAVGMANHCNRIPIIIPCHRVIGSNGGLAGYALGLGIKKALLELEKNNL